MKAVIFCIGMDQVDFDGIVDMLLGTYDPKQFADEILGTIEGGGLFALEIEVVHAWVIPSELEDLTQKDIDQMIDFMKGRSYFFRLANADPSFKILQGDIDDSRLPEPTPEEQSKE